MTQQAHFSVGQLVHHLRFDYRGVVVDVDAEFEGSDEWYELVAASCPPKDRPWYHALVDGAEHMTYVAERNLEADWSSEPVEHPAVNLFFTGYKNGSYQPRHSIN